MSTLQQLFLDLEYARDNMHNLDTKESLHELVEQVDGAIEEYNVMVAELRLRRDAQWLEASTP
jgi:hypothetical protein